MCAAPKPVSASSCRVCVSDDCPLCCASPQDNQIRIFADSRELSKSMVCLIE